MSLLDQCEARFVELIAAIDTVTALDHEPGHEALPKHLPAVTMLYRGTQEDDAETGPGVDTTMEWTIRLYITLADFRVAQLKMKEIVPQMLAAIRQDPRLQDVADFVNLHDDREEPEFDREVGLLIKRMRFVVRGYRAGAEL